MVPAAVVLEPCVVLAPDIGVVVPGACVVLEAVVVSWPVVVVSDPVGAGTVAETLETHEYCVHADHACLTWLTFDTCCS